MLENPEEIWVCSPVKGALYNRVHGHEDRRSSELFFM